MDFLFDIPYVFRVLLSLVVILITNKVFKQLLVSLSIGTICLALWCGHSFETIAAISWRRFSGLDNLLLMTVVSQVIWLSSQMSRIGVMSALVDSVRALVSQRTAMAMLPAVIGLLPMPGGAIFSAPLLDDCDRGNNIEPLLKTKINYWFRHIWEYWWPLYPGVILAIALTGLPMSTFMLLQFPLSFFSLLGGYFFLLRKIDNSKTAAPAGDSKRASLKKIVILVMPIIIVITTYLSINVFLPAVAKINNYLPMISGIVLAQVYLQIRRPLAWREWIKILFSRKVFAMAILAGTIRVYGAFIEAQLGDGTLLMGHVRDELASWNIPLLLVMVLIPFISGITTGIAIGFVGAGFPIVMSLLGSAPAPGVLLSTTLLAYAAGYIGMILSPVHVCLIVTNQHFKTSLTSSILELIKPAAVVASGAVGLYFLIRYILF